MRIALVAIAVTAATPALAQRVDTRRIDIQPGPRPHYDSCNFTAVQNLRLEEYGGGDAARASWTAKAAGAAPHGATLLIGFAPVPGDPSSTEIEKAGAEIEAPDLPDDASAHLFVDGADSGLTLDVAPSYPRGRRFLAIARDGERASVVERMIAGTTAEIVLTGPSGAVLGRYGFDVYQLRRIPELLELVLWSCTSPDRG
jgi:hypothetical protein